MKRAIKVSLKSATATKLRRLSHVVRKYRKLTNRYIKFIWEGDGKLNAATLNAVPCPTLGYRQRSDCLKYALEIVAATKASAKSLGITPQRPALKRSIKFSSLTATVEKGKGSFDYVLKVSGVVAGQRIVLPFKSHKRLNHWLAKPLAKILNGCVTDGKTAVLWIDLPDVAKKEEGDSLGIDIGYNKLLADSDGEQYGERIRELCQKVRSKEPGSLGKRRARRERDDYIHWAVKQLPWGRIKVIAVEDLKNLKKGKSKNRSKNFRKTIAPWTYRQVIERVEQLAEENRVDLRFVNPRNTSRECPSCGKVAKENRVGETFRCIVCGYSADADFVGAVNVLARTTGNSPQSMVAASSANISKV